MCGRTHHPCARTVGPGRLHQLLEGKQPTYRHANAFDQVCDRTHHLCGRTDEDDALEAYMVKK
ncbi:hypothetical protein LXL04_029350 [Taraxacum kok-saghyz]